MLNQFRNLTARVAYLTDDGLRYSFYFSLSRAVLQVAAISVVEFLWKNAGEIERVAVSDHAKRLLYPSDGDLVKLIDWCLPLIRSSGWGGCVPEWFSQKGGGELESAPLRDVALKWVSARNNRPGHGVVDQQTIARGLETLPETTNALVEGVRDLLPEVADGMRLYLRPPHGEIQVESYFLVDGSPVLIRSFERRGATWRARYQTLDPERSIEGIREMPETAAILAAVTDTASILRSSDLSVGGTLWSPSYVLPFRPTDAFRGRRDELHYLEDWWNDLDSRTCLVFGEGGIGKTTLVVEFLHRLLESPPDNLIWKPDLIFFHSAKQTRWGVNGVEYLRGVVPTVAEAVRALVGVLVKPIAREWMEENPYAVIDRASAVLLDAGLSRNSVAFVLDNTETLARTVDEEDQLGRVLRHVGSKLGRLVITSRRRELVEARPVEVQRMAENAGASLLKELGKIYGADSLVRAGDRTLRLVSRQLSGKPLLLDVLARYLSRAGCGIDDGVRMILRQERGELGEFLFEDAWQRMDQAHRRIFLVVGQLGGAVNGQLLKSVCGELGVSLTEWLNAFDETRFGSLNDYGTHFDVVLESGAREYLSKKYADAHSAHQGQINRAAAQARHMAEQILRAENAAVTDRVLSAFRTSAAKAAKLAADRGDVEEAVQWYQEAVRIDPGNASLLDRFAWYLMVNKVLPQARHVAEQACKTAPNDADAHFTAGMIAARLGHVSDADRLLQIAHDLGKGRHLCDLQAARARIKHVKQRARDGRADPADSRKLMSEAYKLLREFRGVAEDSYSMQQKNAAEKERLLKQVDDLVVELGWRRSTR